MIGILVGGKGTRIRDFKTTPKPLIKINNREILKWIINIYTKNNLNQFILLCRSDNIELFKQFKKKYKKINIRVVDTGLNSETGKRISYLKNFIGNEKFFFLTYGDSLGNFNAKSSIRKLKKSKILLNIYQKKSEFGELIVKNQKVFKFNEKKNIQNINAGFYIIKKEVLDIIGSKNISFEKNVIPNMVKKKLVSFNLISKWHPMDNKVQYISIRDWVLKNFKYYDFN